MKPRETFKQFQLHFHRPNIAQPQKPIIIRGLLSAQQLQKQQLHPLSIVSQALFHRPPLILPLSIAVTQKLTTTPRLTFVLLPSETP